MSPSDSATSNFARRVRPLAIFGPWSELSTSSHNQNCGVATTGCLADSSSPALFPHGGFGSLIVSGNLSRDGAIFYASRILSFLPGMTTKTIHAPMRKCVFYEDLMMYRDSRRKVRKFSSIRRFCRYCGIRPGTSGSISWAQLYWSKQPSFRTADIAIARESGNWRHGKVLCPVASKSRCRRTLLVKSQRPAEPIIALDSLLKPSTQIRVRSGIYADSRETNCDDSVLGLAFRAILTSL